MSIRREVRNLFTILPTAWAVGLIVLSLSVGAAELEDIKISVLQVSVWPEYDDPRTLVIYRGELAQEIEPPIQIGFPIPKGASINGAGRIGSDGNLLLEPHIVSPAGEFDQITINLSQRVFFLEYYYTPPAAGGLEEGVRTRDFTYTLIPNYFVEQLIISLQQPLRSSDFIAAPQPMEVLEDQAGFRYHNYTHTGVQPGNRFDIKISYKKSDPRPSVASETAAPPQTVAEGQTSTQLVAAVAMVSIAGGAVIAIATYAIVSRNRKRASKPRKSIAKGTNMTKKNENRVNYCYSCGSKVDQADKFCAHCGTDLGRIF